MRSIELIILHNLRKWLMSHIRPELSAVIRFDFYCTMIRLLVDL